jgi:hypothetical protein
MGKKESADMSGEEYLHGRRAGVEGTHGQKRKGVAEKTVIGSGDQSDGGTLDSELRSAASSLYRDAVDNRGDKDGDHALTER